MAITEHRTWYSI